MHIAVEVKGIFQVLALLRIYLKGGSALPCFTTVNIFMKRH